MFHVIPVSVLAIQVREDWEGPWLIIIGGSLHVVPNAFRGKYWLRAIACFNMRMDWILFEQFIRVWFEVAWIEQDSAVISIGQGCLEDFDSESLKIIGRWKVGFEIFDLFIETSDVSAILCPRHFD